jgi:hypothetical protein
VCLGNGLAVSLRSASTLDEPCRVIHARRECDYGTLTQARGEEVGAENRSWHECVIY